MNLSNNKTYLYTIGILSNIINHIIEIVVAISLIAGCIIATLFEHNQISFTTATIIVVSLTIISLLLLVIKRKDK